MPNEINFAIRTVKNGKVKIGGKYFTCTEKHPAGHKYHIPGFDLSTLEGLRFAFGRYKRMGADKGAYYYDSFVHCWGTERDFRSKELDENGYPIQHDFGQFPLSVNGYDLYSFWDEIKKDDNDGKG